MLNPYSDKSTLEVRVGCGKGGLEEKELMTLEQFLCASQALPGQVLSSQQA